MDATTRRHRRGSTMSRYIAATLLAIAAAVISVTAAVMLEHSDSGNSAFVVLP